MQSHRAEDPAYLHCSFNISVRFKNVKPMYEVPDLLLMALERSTSLSNVLGVLPRLYPILGPLPRHDRVI